MPPTQTNPIENAVRLWKTEIIPESSTPFGAWLFTDTDEAAAEAKKYMDQPFLANRITTLNAFALQLVREHCPELTFIRLDERIIIFETLAKKMDFMQKIRSDTNTAGPAKDTIPLSFITHLIGRYNYFRLNKITIPRKTAKHAAVADLFEAYETYCREHRLADGIIILEKATELLRQEREGGSGVVSIEKSVICDIRHPCDTEHTGYTGRPCDIKRPCDFKRTCGIKRPEPLVEDLLTEILKRDHIENWEELPKELPKDEKSTPAVKFIPSAEETEYLTFRSRESEAEQILERAAELIEDGVSPSEILIITPSGSETARLIAENASDFYAESESVPRPLQVKGPAAGDAIAAHPVIRCVLSALHAVAASFELDDLESVVSSPYLKAPASYGITGALTAGMLEQMGAAFGTESGEKNWRRIADLVAEKCAEEDADPHNNYRRFEAAAKEIKPLLSWIKEVAGPSADAAPGLSSAPGAAPLPRPKTFRSRSDALLRWLEAARWTQPQTDAAAAAAQKVFLNYLTSVSGTVTGDCRCSAQDFSAHILRYAMSRRAEVRIIPAECIRNVPLRKCAGLRADYVFLAGLEAEHLPAADQILSPFTAAETAELLAPLGKDTFREEEERFSSALQTARKKLYLSYAESDGKKQFVRSVFLNGFSGFTDQDAAVSLKKKEKEIRHSVKRNRIRAGHALRDPERCDAALSGAAGLPDSEAVIRRISGTGVKPGVFEGDAKEIFSKMYGGEVSNLSPTSIETYLKCPYQWYLSRHLYLFSASEIDAAATRKGIVVHAILEEFVNTFGKPVTDDNIDEAYDFILKIAREKFAAEKLETPEWKAAASWYCDDGDDERGHYQPLRKFLEKEKELANQGWETANSKTECEFNETIQREGFSFAVKGYIDRVIEKDSTGPDGKKIREFCIIDYKTGNVPDKKYAMQLPLYAAAYQQESGSTPKDGTYFQLKERETNFKLAAKDGDFPGMMEEKLKTVAEAVDSIRDAELRPTPDKDVCKYCKYDRFCRSAVKPSWGGA